MRTNFRSTGAVLWRILSRHIAGVAATAVLLGLTGLMVSAFAIPERYEAHTLLYIEPNHNPDRPADLNAVNEAQNIAGSCVVLFESDDCLQELIDLHRLNVTPAELRGSTDVSVVDRSMVLRLSVAASDSETALALTNDYTDICIRRCEQLITVGNIQLGAPAVANAVPRNIAGFTAGGFCLGWFGSYICFMAGELLDRKIKSADDLYVIYDLPVLGVIPLLHDEKASRLL
jgi:capsular polysaccharide biosynthesis protein